MGRRVRALLAVLALGCGSTDAPPQTPPEPGPSSAELPPGWITALLADPDAFDAAISEGERPRWVAAHGGQWVAPGTGERGEPGFVPAQAHTERALGALEAALYQRLLQTWSQRGQLPPDDPLPWLAWLAGLDHGAATVPPPQPALAGIESIDELGTRGDLPQAVRQCVSAHLEARAADALPPAGACAALTSPARPDPLARTTRALALDALPVTDNTVGRAAFTGRWGAEDAPCPVAGGLAAWEDAAQSLRALTTALDATEQPGSPLVDELRIGTALRSRRLGRCAVEALVAGTVSAPELLPRLEALVDAGLGERVGPTNPPIVFAALALARLHAGRSRATLDALHALRTAWVELPPLGELAGDYHVAVGLGRDGDSKEH